MRWRDDGDGDRDSDRERGWKIVKLWWDRDSETMGRSDWLRDSTQRQRQWLRQGQMERDSDRERLRETHDRERRRQRPFEKRQWWETATEKDRVTQTQRLRQISYKRYAVPAPNREHINVHTLAWVVTSCGESCGSSLGCVCTHPKGSISFKKSCWGSWFGRWTVWCVPHCGTNTIQRISFT